MTTPSELTNKLEELLNSVSRENKSNTPDFILAQFMMGCLRSYEAAVNERDKWYSFTPWEGRE